MPEIATLLVHRTLIDGEYGKVTAVFIQMLAAIQCGEDVDVVPLVHELTDLIFVSYGAIWACGVDPDPIIAEVHRANMQKASGPRRADDKVLKPADWQPPNVHSVV